MWDVRGGDCGWQGFWPEDSVGIYYDRKLQDKQVWGAKWRFRSEVLGWCSHWGGGTWVEIGPWALVSHPGMAQGSEVAGSTLGDGMAQCLATQIWSLRVDVNLSSVSDITSLSPVFSSGKMGIIPHYLCSRVTVKVK